MTLRLSVDEKAWGDHVRRTVLALGDVMPVVKGNGYGFGRSVLMPHAAAIARDVAVGSVYELVDVPDAMRPFVLTPVASASMPQSATQSDAMPYSPWRHRTTCSSWAALAHVIRWW